MTAIAVTVRQRVNEFDDDILDPDFTLPSHEENDLDGILAFDSDSNEGVCDSSEVEQRQTGLGPEIISEESNEVQKHQPVLGPVVIEETSEEETPSTHTGKKRKREPKNWKRNVLITKKAKGEQYINIQNK